MDKEPILLISNDDGVASEYLDLLVESVVDLGKIVVVAPAQNQSSMGRSYPSGERVGIITKVEKNILGNTIEAYGVEASPALCICHAMAEIMSKKPTICLTGINPGENVGSTMTGSGTIMGAIEASSYQMPAIAFSKYGSFEGQKEPIKQKIKSLVLKVLENGLPQGVPALSVNFPQIVFENTPSEITRLSSQIYFESKAVEKRDWSKPYDLPTIRKFDVETLEKDSDIYCLIEKKHISITPISWDFTAHNQQFGVRQRLNL